MSTETTQSRPGVLAPGGIWRNWGRSASSNPTWVARPTTVGEVVDIVKWAGATGLTVKTVGAGHSFTPIAATDGVLLDLGWIEGVVAVDEALGQVTLGAGTNLHQLPDILRPYGLALANMGDIDRQTIAGAISTGTHGTGAGFGGLATQVVGMTLVIGDGSILRVTETKNAELLPAVRLGLGALGVIVDVTLQCVPAYLLSAVERPENLDAVLAEFEQRSTAVDHFEFYWWPHTDAVSTKSNTRLAGDAERAPLHPVGEWWEDRLLSNGALSLMCAVGRIAPSATPAINRLATKLVGNRDFTDYSHRVFVSPRTVRFREMEYAIPRASVPAALRDIRTLIENRGWRISFPIEVRVAAADANWLSTAHGRDAGYIAVHRHYRDDPEEYFRAVEQIMRGYGGRPHWGKLHYQDAGSLAPLYPHFADFVAVRDRLDPGRVFANPYLTRVLGA
ncbi:D-arabinono-1,4-lactone oxidase [Lacisediminihabitans changchengi]|uniref:D-arabinono-1,4-lactone oxidase n=1 Tax=Lacisediminihabitans changchengi TaxID=2787634 RepID=UPI0027DDF0D1|nr:D-arabinono-1,4-lactone oxidase [Lacisediminihabitans changchengi]